MLPIPFSTKMIWNRLFTTGIGITFLCIFACSQPKPFRFDNAYLDMKTRREEGRTREKEMNYTLETLTLERPLIRETIIRRGFLTEKEDIIALSHDIADELGLDRNSFEALTYVETTFMTKSIDDILSPVGAAGHNQIMPKLAMQYMPNLHLFKWDEYKTKLEEYKRATEKEILLKTPDSLRTAFTNFQDYRRKWRNELAYTIRQECMENDKIDYDKLIQIHELFDSRINMTISGLYLIDMNSRKNNSDKVFAGYYVGESRVKNSIPPKGAAYVNKLRIYLHSKGQTELQVIGNKGTYNFTLGKIRKNRKFQVAFKIN